MTSGPVHLSPTPPPPFPLATGHSVPCPRRPESPPSGLLLSLRPVELSAGGGVNKKRARIPGIAQVMMGDLYKWMRHGKIVDLEGRRVGGWGRSSTVGWVREFQY